MNVIETGRLRLRWFAEPDAAFILELLNEPEWKQYIGDKNVTTLAAARDYIESGPCTSYRRYGFGLWAMQRKSDAELVGMCGLIKRDTLADVDLGFALLARHAGKGYAQEAAAATLAYARDTLGLARVVAITTPDNTRSARVVERLGMRRSGTVRIVDESLNLYTLAFADPLK